MNHRNDQHNDDSSRLKQLSEEKGRLSRKIGDAKKKQIDCSQLIAEMREISTAIKQLKATIKTSSKRSSNTLQAPQAEPPAHFSPAPAVNEKPLNLQIITLDDQNAEERWQEDWNIYVTDNPRCSAYHHYAFKQIIQEVFQQTPHYLMAVNQQNKVVGILPSVQLKSRIFGNFIVSMPYFNYGGAIGDNTEVEEQLIIALIQKAKKLGIEHIEIRETQSRTSYQSRTDKASMLLPLPATEEELWQQIGSKVRAQINRAKSNNLSIQIGQSELLGDFYQVFSENMRDLGTPVYSQTFFSTLLGQLNFSSHGRQIPKAELIVAYNRAGKAISAGFLIHNKSTVEIPWASTLRSANALNANMYLYWQILSHCINSGADFFDFGRSSKDAGTFKFKKQWGAKPLQLYWHYWLPDNAPLPAITTNNPKYRLAIKIWQRLPVWFTRLIGPHIVKHIP